MSRRLILFLLIVTCGAAFAATPGRVIIGVSTHFPNREGLDLLEQAGIDSIRNDLWWADIEKKRGEYRMPKEFSSLIDDALDRDLAPLAILDYGNPLYERGARPSTSVGREAFARYAEFCARTFRGRVPYWEVWNEWNWGTGFPPGTPPGSGEDYVELLKKAYPRIKAVDPRAIVLSAGMSGADLAWLEDACRAGLLNYCDGVAVHPYCYGALGDGYLVEKGWLERVEACRKLLNRFRGGKNKPLYITEIGWPNFESNKRRFTPAESAACLSRLFLLAASRPDVAGIWWYDFRDDGLDPKEREHNFGIVFNDLTPKPAYYALRETAAFLKRSVFVPEKTKAPDEVRMLRFRTDDDTDAFAVWSVPEGQIWRITWVAPRNWTGKKVKLVTIGEGEVRRKWDVDLEKDRGILSVTVGSVPLLVEGDFGSAVIHEIRRIR